jgi:serine/threonine-protein kinase
VGVNLRFSPPETRRRVEESPISIAGRTFADRYAVEQELGRGATSIVYLARDLAQGRMVAIKTLRRELAETLSANRFLREIRLVAALHHPHIVPLLDSGEADGVLYCVMPYMDGGTLRDRLTRDKQLPLDQAVSIVRTIAGALDSAHSKGLVHRDVKPANILFAAGQPCLGDFGIARALVRGSDDDSTTTTGLVRGTPAYMSPEQASGNQHYDGRSDIYSLGCVLYEAIAGVQPFVGPTSESVLAQRMVHAPRPLNVYRPTVPDELAAVIDRALMVTAEDRYQTAAEFEAALASVEPLLSSGRSTGQRVPVYHDAARAARRRWIAGGILVALATVGGVVGRALSRGAERPDDNRLVVAPFSVFDPADSVWREGLMDMFQTSFDGAGPIRTVSPSVAMQGWKGERFDRASATKLGQRMRARYALFGQLFRAGRDSSRLAASLIDIVSGRAFPVEVRDATDHLDRLIDSATVRLLNDLNRVRPIAAVARAAMGSRSIEALKAFLQGEQLYRANDVMGARDAYLQAIAADSGFALAYRRMKGVWRATPGRQEDDSTGDAYALRAGARNHGLGLRDSLLIVADSLAAAKPRGSVFLSDMELGQLRRRVAALQAARHNYADDPEVQYEFGEAAYHIGERVGLSQRQSLDAFLESIRLDSAFLPSYYHAVELALSLDGGGERAVRLSTQYDSFNPRAPRYELLRKLLGARGTRDLDRVVAESDRDSIGAVREAIELTRRWPDDLATAIRICRRFLQRPDLSRDDSATAQFWLPATLLFRGRVRDARAVITREGADKLDLYFHLAELDQFPADSAIRMGEEWARRTDERGLYRSIPLRASSGDTTSLKELIAHFRAELAPGKPAKAQPIAMAGFQSATAHLALARHDSSAALRGFLAIPDSLCSWWCAEDRLTTAHLLRVLKSRREAAEYLDRHPPGAGLTTIAEPLWRLERSRAEEGSNPTEAAQDLKFVKLAWSRADSSLLARYLTNSAARTP